MSSQASRTTNVPVKQHINARDGSCAVCGVLASPTVQQVCYLVDHVGFYRKVSLAPDSSRIKQFTGLINLHLKVEAWRSFNLVPSGEVSRLMTVSRICSSVSTLSSYCSDPF